MKDAHTRPPFAAILFDCDGVIADSEPVVNIVVAEDLSARGWPLTPDEAGANFLGMSLPTMIPMIEAQVGPLPSGWSQDLKVRVAETMSREVTPIPGAAEVLEAARAAHIPIAMASNSSRVELTAKLTRLGFQAFFEGHVFSFEDVPRAKPDPDIYLAAAASCNADPADCVVIEDSVMGVRAGVAAGCTVFGFAHVTDPEELLAAGVQLVFNDMAQLPELLGLKPTLSTA
jgi:HAD superfamily hydrolase (TIGR01509 family)